jgi:dolichol kinase
MYFMNEFNGQIIEKGKKGNNNSISLSYLLKKEFFRKLIHMMAAFVPFFYYFSQNLVITLLLGVTLFYFFSEVLRAKGISVPIITSVTEIAARPRDKGKIILGPITLSMGIFLALILFDYRIAIISVFALAFGDGVASLFGQIVGGWKIPLTLGKTIGGSSGCFIVLIIVFVACGLNISQAVLLALIASIIEVFPTGDYDNLLIPVLTGLFAKNIIL